MLQRLHHSTPFSHIFSLFFILILNVSTLFSAHLEGNVWMDNGCLGGPVGCPIEGATITAAGGQNGTVTDAYTGTSNENGHYALELPSGYYFVSCAKEGWITQEISLYIHEDGIEHDFYLPETDVNPPSIYFSGQVYGTMGGMLPAMEHLAGAHVEVFGGNDWGFELYFETETNADGYFEFEYAVTPGGSWFTDALVKISAEGYTTHEEWVNFSEPVLGHEFYLNPLTNPNPEAYFSGNVFATYPNSTGLPTPIHNAHVKLYGGFTGGLLAETETNDNGYFEFGDVVMSSQSYSIEADGYLPIEGNIWDFCNTIDPSTNECFPIYSDFYLEPENTEPTTAVLYGQVTAQMSPMGPMFPVAGAIISTFHGWANEDVIHETESNEDGHYELIVNLPDNNWSSDYEFEVMAISEYGTQTQIVTLEPNHETELNFHFNNFDNQNPAPTNLSAYIGDDNLTAYLEWDGVDVVTGVNPMYNVYMQNNWLDDSEWFLLGTTGDSHFEFALAINTIIENPCFKVTALYNGMESEPSNVACLEFDDGNDDGGDDGGGHVSAPYDLTAEFEPMPLGGLVYLNWTHGDANTDPANQTMGFHIYAYYGWDDMEWSLVGESISPNFEYMLGDFWWPEELCFKVTAVQNGNESEPSNIACAWDDPNPDPECEDLSDFHFGACEMVIGIGFNGEECTWYSGCGTQDQFGNDHANSFFDSIEECNEACGLGNHDCDPNLECAAVLTCVDELMYPTSCGPENCDDPIGDCEHGGDDGGDDPFACLMDCEGMYDLNPEEDPDGACEWFLGLPNSECVEDCNEEVFAMLGQITEVCEMCLDGMFDCGDIFDEDGNDDGGDDGGDDGPPECIMDCEGVYDVDPDENPDATCEWLVNTLNADNECTSDCDEETLGFLYELSGLCEQCLDGAFECADIFDDGNDDGGGEDGHLYGYVEYVWGDAIEMVAGAHIMIQSINEDGTMMEVYETTTNEMGQYEISLPAGPYMVTASAYDDSETNDVYIEGGQDHELNFQLGEFYYPDIYALSGMVNGSDGPNNETYPLPGAQVRAECLSTGDVFETNAGEGGYYWLYLPLPDAYSVTVSHDGYQSTTQIFEVFGIVEANFNLNSDGGTDAEAILSLGDGYGGPEGFTVPLYLNSSQPVSGLQFAVWPMLETWDYYFIPGEVEVLNDCFSGDGNDVYGQLWGIIFSLEGCVYEPGEDHHVANLSFTVEGNVPAGAQVPLVFNYTLVSDPDANEIPSAGEGSMVTFGQSGDVNGDGAINVVDIVNMVNFALQIDEPTEYESWAADLNQDGDINILDIVSVVNIILYGDDLQRSDSGDAEIYHNEKEVHIEGADVAGFQIEFDKVIQIDQLQIPDGWASVIHENSIIAYAQHGNLLDGRSIIKLNQSAEIVELTVADANGESIMASINMLPNTVSLKGNFPNPFNPETSIAYTLSHDSQVILSVYDLSGRLVETLVDGQQYPGEFSVDWSAQQLPSGMYIARLMVNGESFTKKMMLMK